MHAVFVALILKFQSVSLPQRTSHLDQKSEDPTKGVELTQIHLADLLKILVLKWITRLRIVPHNNQKSESARRTTNRAFIRFLCQGKTKILTYMY